MITMKASQDLADHIFAKRETEIRQGLARNGYFVLQDEAFARCVSDAREEYLAILPAVALNPQRSRLDRADLERQPWRKVAIGATNGVGEPYAQFLTTTYFSGRTASMPALNFLFFVLLNVRDRLFEIGPQTQLDGVWNACRVHHYPRGGGFMSEHRDTHFPKVLGTAGMPFLQVSACMSKRGTDFNTGGGFVVDKSGNKIDLESYGSMILFDGNQRHGVDCVDLDALPDIRATTGRLAAFTNFYEILG